MESFEREELELKEINFLSTEEAIKEMLMVLVKVNPFSVIERVVYMSCQYTE